MIELPFASYCNRYPDATGWVVGRGPTRFPYERLAEAPGPVFFVNDAVGAEKYLTAGQPSFFFAHDRSMTPWLAQGHLHSLPVLITDQPMTGGGLHKIRGLLQGRDDPILERLGPVILYTKGGPIEQADILQRSREEVKVTGQLHLRGGTIHPLIHFAWYTGCTRLVMIGCDGLPTVGYEPRLENLSRSTQVGAFAIRIQADAICSSLGLSVEYAGTPPHSVFSLVEVRAQADRAEAMGQWAADLKAYFEARQARRVETKDAVAEEGGCWVEAEWPSVAVCAEAYGSGDYAVKVSVGLATATGEERPRLKTAFKALIAG